MQQEQKTNVKLKEYVRERKVKGKKNAKSNLGEIGGKRNAK